jgi:hypothetical protein
MQVNWLYRKIIQNSEIISLVIVTGWNFFGGRTALMSLETDTEERGKSNNADKQNMRNHWHEVRSGNPERGICFFIGRASGKKE